MVSDIEDIKSQQVTHTRNATYSHAEAALAGGRDVGILSNLGVVKSGIKGGSSSTGEQGRLGINLVRGRRFQEGSGHSKEEGKQDGGNNALHGGKRIFSSLAGKLKL
jgi:hypothetical protein